MPKKLKNLVVENIGLVDVGANPEAAMMLVKRDTKPATTGSGADVIRIVLKEPTHA